jgi:hypothetical protein
MTGKAGGMPPAGQIAPDKRPSRQCLISCRDADFRVLIRTVPILDYFRIADHLPAITVSFQVEHKQFIGNGHLIGSSMR